MQTTTTTLETLGQRIDRLRQERGFDSLADLGRAIGINPANISSYVHGHAYPNFRTLVRFARALDVPLSVLVADIAEDRPGARLTRARKRERATSS